MKPTDLMSINPLLAERARLAIMANLSLAGGPVDFNTSNCHHHSTRH